MSLDFAKRQTSDEITEECRRRLAHCEEILAWFEEREHEDWKKLAGETAEPMLQSRQAAANYLAHAEPRLRIAALDILRRQWRSDAGFVEICEKIAFYDPAAEVRGIALINLSDCYQGTNDPRIGKLLVNIIRDESQPENIRYDAYEGLFKLRGLHLDHWPTMRRICGDFNFPGDIDWEFVNSFVQDTK